MTKILNIGSINIDHVYRVPHFVQPGETLHALSLTNFPGGKGLNQSVALALAGGTVAHAGKVGSDGGEMIAVLRRAGADVSLVDESGSATGHAVIQVSERGQNCILLHRGANYELDKAFVDRALAAYGEGDILVLQNEVAQLPYIMESAHQKGMRIAFNPSPIGPEIDACPLETVSWFLLNEIEGAALSGEKDHAMVLNAMAQKYPNAAIVLTVGKNGVLYKDKTQTLRHGIYKVPVVDTTAAGDTFTGFFIGLTAQGENPTEALRLASVASSIAVSRAGASVSIPTLAQVKEAKLTPG